jgi:uncharacterized repeat protein (TIGR01451 family)
MNRRLRNFAKSAIGVLTLCIVAANGSAVLANTIFWDTPTGSGNWDNSGNQSNWSGGQVPGVSDFVSFENGAQFPHPYTVTFPSRPIGINDPGDVNYSTSYLRVRDNGVTFDGSNQNFFGPSTYAVVSTTQTEANRGIIIGETAGENASLSDSHSGFTCCGRLSSLSGVAATLGDSAGAAGTLNGHVLMAVGIWASTGNTTHVFEYDPAAPVASSLTDVTPASPNLSTTVPYVTRMLVLPSGQVLFDDGSSQLYVYTPQGLPQAAWKPTITSVVTNGSHFTLSGTQLNGISAGASYGDDAEMDTNYPIVQLKAKDGSGKVYFARTTNWSSTGVATGSLPVSTDFSLPAYMPFGTYSLSVVANGIASDPVDFMGGFTGSGADLAVTFVAPNTGTEGYNNTYNVTVRNLGPNNAAGVVLTDTLGANLKYVSATKSQGTFTQSGSAITFSLGSIAAGQTAMATITAQPLEDGNLTNNFSVTSSTVDMNPGNNTALSVAAIAEGSIYVSGPTAVNGKKVNNQTVATFTHANGIDPASAFVATINWGDGTTSAGTISFSGTTYSVKGSHTFVSGGSHTISTTVTEPESGAKTASPEMLADLVARVLTGATANSHASAAGILSSAVHANPAAQAKTSTVDPALVDLVVAELTSSTTGLFSDLSAEGEFLASLDAVAAEANQASINPDKSLLLDDELIKALGSFE